MLLRPNSRLRQCGGRVGTGSRGGGVRAAAWTPASLTGLAADLLIAEARSTGRLWQDTAKTIPAVADGDPVRVAQGRYVSMEWAAPSDAARPLLYDEGGGLWSLEFDGIDDRLTVSNGTLFVASGDSAVSVAYRGLASSAKGAFWKSGGMGDGYGVGVGTTSFDANGANVLAIREGIAWVDTGLDHLQSGRVVAVASHAGGGAYDLGYYRNNVAGTPQTAVAISSPTGSGAVGAYADGGRPLAGRMGGVLVQHAVPTGGELSEIDTYLGAL